MFLLNVFLLQTDLEHRRAVSTEEGEQFAREHGLYFIETSKNTTGAFSLCAAG